MTLSVQTADPVPHWTMPVLQGFAGMQAVPQAAEVERSSPYEQDLHAPRAAVLHGCRGGLQPGCDAERLGWRNEVDAVVEHGRPFGRARLGGAEVEATVDRHRVDTHDLGPEPASQGDREGRFAGGGGPGEKPAIRPQPGADSG